MIIQWLKSKRAMLNEIHRLRAQNKELQRKNRTYRQLCINMSGKLVELLDNEMFLFKVETQIEQLAGSKE